MLQSLVSWGNDVYSFGTASKWKLADRMVASVNGAWQVVKLLWLSMAPLEYFTVRIFRGRIAATPRPRRGYSMERVAATPRPTTWTFLTPQVRGLDRRDPRGAGLLPERAGVPPLARAQGADARQLRRVFVLARGVARDPAVRGGGLDVSARRAPRLRLRRAVDGELRVLSQGRNREDVTGSRAVDLETKYERFYD